MKSNDALQLVLGLGQQLAAPTTRPTSVNDRLWPIVQQSVPLHRQRAVMSAMMKLYSVDGVRDEPLLAQLIQAAARLPVTTNLYAYFQKEGRAVRARADMLNGDRGAQESERFKREEREWLAQALTEQQNSRHNPHGGSR